MSLTQIVEKSYRHIQIQHNTVFEYNYLMVKTQGTSKHSKYVCSITYIEKANKSQDFSTQIHAEDFKLKNKLMSSNDIIYIKIAAI